MTWLLPIALGGYMTLNGVDLAQTMACVGAQRCREGNPAMRLMVDHPATFGAAKIGLDSAAVAGILHLRTNHPKLAWALTALGLSVETAATVHNARRMR